MLRKYYQTRHSSRHHPRDDEEGDDDYVYDNNGNDVGVMEVQCACAQITTKLWHIFVSITFKNLIVEVRI